MILTTEEAAEWAGVSPSTVRSWVMRGHLTPLRRGAKPLRFRWSDVAECQRNLRSSEWRERHHAAASEWRVCIEGNDVQR